jgi:NADPH:quinone reductase-like Zn-dependent oxidoreductase
LRAGASRTATGSSSSSADEFAPPALKELIEAGKLTPVIGRTYPLGESPEAIRYLEEGHARGKVIIAV